MPDHDDVGGRRGWFLRTRVGSDGKLTPGQWFNASRQHRRAHRGFLEGFGITLEAPGLAGTVNWTPLGPSTIVNGQAIGNPNVSGRVTALAVGPGGTRIYLGSANGGVWFSRDGGANWTALDEFVVSPNKIPHREADSLSVGAVAVRFDATTAAKDIVFVGTGEPSAGDAYFGVGIKFSNDGGTRFHAEATHLNSSAIYKIIIDPKPSPLLVFAATSTGLYKRPEQEPFTHWQRVNSPNFTNSAGKATDLIVVGTGSTKKYYVAFDSDQVYESSHDDANWTAVAGFTAGGRIALTAGEDKPSIIYALSYLPSYDANNNVVNCHPQLVRRDGAGSFKSVTGVPPDLFGKQGYYDIVIAADPGDAENVYLAGGAIELLTGIGGEKQWNLAFWKCAVVNGGSAAPSLNPTFIGKGVHADAHALAFATNTDGTHDRRFVWVGTDGGPFASRSSGNVGSFSAQNTGLNITQINYIAQRPDTDAVIFAGCQDNGTIRYWGEPAWFEAPQGDGGGIVFDPRDPRRVMRQYTWVDLTRALDGGLHADSWKPVPFPPAVQATQHGDTTEQGYTRFYSPIRAIKVDNSTTRAAFGTRRLWVTEDWGTNWVTWPTDSNPLRNPMTPDYHQDSLGGSVVDIRFESASVVFVATPTGVFKIERGNKQPLGRPSSITNANPITAIDVEGAGKFYAVFGGATASHAINRVWYCDGTQWHDAGLSKDVLDSPVHAVAVDPNNPSNVYIGADVGVWKGIKSGNTWTWDFFSLGLPEAPILDLAVHPLGRLLRAGTHGRGVWEIPLWTDTASKKNPDLYLRANYADSGRLYNGERQSWIDSAKDPTVPTRQVNRFSSADIKVLRHAKVKAGLEYDYSEFATLQSSLNDADMSGANRIFVQIHNRGSAGVPAHQIKVILLLADAPNGTPALPQDYVTRIRNGDTSAWVQSSGWKFADSAHPFRVPPRTLTVDAPQVVYYDLDFVGMGLNGARTCALALVTADPSPLPATQKAGGGGNETNVEALVLKNPQVAARNFANG